MRAIVLGPSCQVRPPQPVVGGRRDQRPGLAIERVERGTRRHHAPQVVIIRRGGAYGRVIGRVAHTTFIYNGPASPKVVSIAGSDVVVHIRLAGEPAGVLVVFVGGSRGHARAIGAHNLGRIGMAAPIHVRLIAVLGAVAVAVVLPQQVAAAVVRVVGFELPAADDRVRRTQRRGQPAQPVVPLPVLRQVAVGVVNVLAIGAGGAPRRHRGRFE